MLVVLRFRVSEHEGAAFRAEATGVLAVLGARPGHVRGRLGRSADDPELWVLSTEWEGVGAYRRALSAYDVKLATTALLNRAIEEPTAFEVLERVGDDLPPVSRSPDRR